jgi:hypothetical protein
LRQFFVSRSYFSHHLPSLRVAHRLGLGKDFLGACSPATNEQSARATGSGDDDPTLIDEVAA